MSITTNFTTTTGKKIRAVDTTTKEEGFVDVNVWAKPQTLTAAPYTGPLTTSANPFATGNQDVARMGRMLIGQRNTFEVGYTSFESHVQDGADDFHLNTYGGGQQVVLRLGNAEGSINNPVKIPVRSATGEVRFAYYGGGGFNKGVSLVGKYVGNDSASDNRTSFTIYNNGGSPSGVFAWDGGLLLGGSAYVTANPAGNPNDSSRYGVGLDINGRQGIRYEIGTPDTTKMPIGANGTLPDTSGVVEYYERTGPGTVVKKYAYLDTSTNTVITKTFTAI
jgi:hypothetical protein